MKRKKKKQWKKSREREWEMNDVSLATCAENFVRNEVEKARRWRGWRQRVRERERERSFSLETDLRKFITQKTQPSAHEKACKEYGMMEVQSTVGKVAEGWDRNEMKLKYDFVLFICYFSFQLTFPTTFKSDASVFSTFFSWVFIFLLESDFKYFTLTKAEHPQERKQCLRRPL